MSETNREALVQLLEVGLISQEEFELAIEEAGVRVDAGATTRPPVPPASDPTTSEMEITQEDSQRIPGPPDPTGPGSSRQIQLVIAILAWVALAGVGAWQFLPDKEKKPVDPKPRSVVEARPAEDPHAALVRRSEGLLEQHKTNVVANDDASLISTARRNLEKATFAGSEGQSEALFALALVWDQQWHYGKKTWNQAEYLESERVTTTGGATTEPEGLLARAVFLATTCGKATDEALKRTLCAATPPALEAAKQALRNDGRAWLRMELWWGAAAFYSRLANDALKEDDLAAARLSWTSQKEWCATGKDDAASHLVNRTILYKVCAQGSAGLGDVQGYLYWAERYWVENVDQQGEPKAATAWSTFRFAHPDCRELALVKDRASGVYLPQPTTPTEHYCLAAGLKAMGCPNRADTMLQQTSAAGTEYADAMLGAKSTVVANCYVGADAR
ncbi:MAG: hypothetical protein QGG40_14585 [Myxococcota bacterium]|nr:hypothetical protein [Myxococcota bacterium]